MSYNNYQCSEQVFKSKCLCQICIKMNAAYVRTLNIPFQFQIWLVYAIVEKKLSKISLRHFLVFVAWFSHAKNHENSEWLLSKKHQQTDGRTNGRQVGRAGRTDKQDQFYKTPFGRAMGPKTPFVIPTTFSTQASL